MPELNHRESWLERGPRPSCFLESGPDGFAFQIAKGVQMYALHSFLMRIEMKNQREVCFFYTYGTVRVLVAKVGLVYTLALPRVLGGVQPSAVDDLCRHEVEVTEVIFEAAEGATSDSF